MNNFIDQSINKFFEDTTKNHDTSKDIYEFSILYLLVRDIQTCLNINPTIKLKEKFNCEHCNREINVRSQWPAIMGILAGIDLLGKFYDGSNSNYRGEVGRRFKKFLKKFFNINEKESDALYNLRNSMLHSFGLYSDSYKFMLIESKYKKFIEFKTMRTPPPAEIAIINVEKLYNKFIKSISLYKNSLKRNRNLKQNFENMFPYYGISKHGPRRKILRLYI